MIIGGDKVLSDFERFTRNWDREADQIPAEIKASVVREIVRTGSIDTTRMIQAVNYHGGVVTDGHHFTIDTSDDNEVTYDGFVDQPGVTRNWPGRFFNLRGIERANLERIFNMIADESFVV